MHEERGASLELGADVPRAHARLAVRGINLRDITGSSDALKPAHGATAPMHSTATIALRSRRMASV